MGADVQAERGQHRCAACLHDVVRAEHLVREAMFQTGENFVYLECARCRSLCLREIPVSLASYYDPAEYYSLRTRQYAFDHPVFLRAPLQMFSRLLTRFYLLTGVGKGVAWTRAARMRIDDRILDLGCGSGDKLARLRVLGFPNLLGVDPYLAKATTRQGVQLLSQDYSEVEGMFDWVVMNHSFEHIPDTDDALKSVLGVLAESGRLLIRTPVAGTLAWRTYGADWVQIDAPRHINIFTLEGLRSLLQRHGLEIERVFYDSFEFQFWGSELVRSGRTYRTGPIDFERSQLRSWRRQSRRLNRSHDGDQVGVVARRLSV